MEREDDALCMVATVFLCTQSHLLFAENILAAAPQ